MKCRVARRGLAVNVMSPAAACGYAAAMQLSLRFAAALAALCLAGPAFAVRDSALGKYWSAAPARVPYRAIAVKGRDAKAGLPLVVFLHGDWQDGTDNVSQLAGYGNGSMQLIDQARKAGRGLLYIAPQTTTGYWAPAHVAAVIADAQRRWKVDPARIVLTGISNGGSGVWDTLKHYPACFAAAVPMSGMTEPSGLRAIAPVPQWVFHGELDDDTDVEGGYFGAQMGSRVIVAALRALGGTPRYSEYPGEKHVIWPRAYAEKELLPWILAQRLAGPPCDFASLP